MRELTEMDQCHMKISGRFHMSIDSGELKDIEAFIKGICTNTDIDFKNTEPNIEYNGDTGVWYVSIVTTLFDYAKNLNTMTYLIRPQATKYNIGTYNIMFVPDDVNKAVREQLKVIQKIIIDRIDLPFEFDVADVNQASYAFDVLNRITNMYRLKLQEK